MGRRMARAETVRLVTIPGQVFHRWRSQDGADQLRDIKWLIRENMRRRNAVVAVTQESACVRLAPAVLRPLPSHRCPRG